MLDSESPSILVIDDEQVHRSLVMQIFSGCKKASAHNVVSGLEKFKQFCPDITFVDLSLPDGSGFDLLDEILLHDPEAFIAILSASRVSQDVERATKLGANSYITKPFSHSKIQQTVKSYHEHKNKLQLLSPGERVGHYRKVIKNKKTAHANKQIQDNIAKQIKLLTKNLIENWNVAFVDNHAVNRSHAKLYISRLGCQVRCFSDASSMVKSMQHTEYDIIFIDSQLQPNGGYKLAKYIRQETLSQKFTPMIVGLLNYTYEVTDNHWQSASMDAYIKKPANFLQICQIIEKRAEDLVADDL